jgi:hypothetical protein
MTISKKRIAEIAAIPDTAIDTSEIPEVTAEFFQRAHLVRPKRFGKTPVSITLTGEEWFALLARIDGRELSPKGSRIYRDASKKLCAQLGDASDAHTLEKKPPLCSCCGVNRLAYPQSGLCISCHNYEEHTA